MDQEKELQPAETKRIIPLDDLPTAGAPPPIDDFQLINPEEEDITDEIRQMPAFREYEREHRGDSLTFGDY